MDSVDKSAFYIGTYMCFHIFLLWIGTVGCVKEYTVCLLESDRFKVVKTCQIRVGILYCCEESLRIHPYCCFSDFNDHKCFTKWKKVEFCNWGWSTFGLKNQCWNNANDSNFEYVDKHGSIVQKKFDSKFCHQGDYFGNFEPYEYHIHPGGRIWY